MVTAQLICAFVITYAESRFFHDMAQLSRINKNISYQNMTGILLNYMLFHYNIMLEDDAADKSTVTQSDLFQTNVGKY